MRTMLTIVTHATIQRSHLQSVARRIMLTTGKRHDGCDDAKKRDDQTSRASRRIDEREQRSSAMIGCERRAKATVPQVLRRPEGAHRVAPAPFTSAVLTCFSGHEDEKLLENEKWQRRLKRR